MPLRRSLAPKVFEPKRAPSSSFLPCLVLQISNSSFQGREREREYFGERENRRRERENECDGRRERERERMMGGTFKVKF